MAQRTSKYDGVQCITQEIDTEQGLTTPTTPRQGTARLRRKCRCVSSKNAADRTHTPYNMNSPSLRMQICEPITATVIFPFVFWLVNEMGVTRGTKTEQGTILSHIAFFPLSSWPFYALPYGLSRQESTAFLVETSFVLQWGRLPDKIDRIPVVLNGPLGLTPSVLCFGLHSPSPLPSPAGLLSVC